MNIPSAGFIDEQRSSIASYVIRHHFMQTAFKLMTLEALIYKASRNESGLQFPEGRQFVGCGCWIDGSDCSLFSLLICTINDQMRSKIRCDVKDNHNHGHDDDGNRRQTMGKNTPGEDCRPSIRSTMTLLPNGPRHCRSGHNHTPHSVHRWGGRSWCS